MESADQSRAEHQDQLLHACGEKGFLGFARVRLDCLIFPDDVEAMMDSGREVWRQTQIMKIQGCLRYDSQYRVPVCVTAHDWVQRLRMRYDEGMLPELVVPADLTLMGYRNRFVVAAARSHLPTSHQWWIVDLYLQNETPSPTERARFRTFQERFPHTGPVPDGLIYFRIRDYQGHLGREPDQDAEADAWATLLAQSGRRKPDYLKRFLEHKSFPPAFDRLLPIPGLTADFSIGNLQRLMNLHCDERLLCALEQIRSVWADVLLGQDKALWSLVDAQTVRKLQSRAPAISANDKKDLEEAWSENRLFPYLDMSSRQQVSARLQKVRDPIPTLHTFFRDLRYLEVAADVMKRLVPTSLTVTVDQKILQRAGLGDSPAGRSALLRLWQFSLQWGFELTTHRRRRPQGRRSTRPAAHEDESVQTAPANLWSSAMALAQDVGLLPTSIGDQPSSSTSIAVEEVLAKDKDEPYSRRCGRPYVYSAAADRWAFAAPIPETAPEASAVTTTVLRHAFFRCFFADLLTNLPVTPGTQVVRLPAPDLTSDSVAATNLEENNDDHGYESNTGHARIDPTNLPTQWELPLQRFPQTRNRSSRSPGEAVPTAIDDLTSSSVSHTPPVVGSPTNGDMHEKDAFQMNVFNEENQVTESVPLPRDPVAFHERLQEYQDRGLVFSAAPSRGIEFLHCYEAMTQNPGLVLRAGPTTRVGPEMDTLPRSPRSQKRPHNSPALEPRKRRPVHGDSWVQQMRKQLRESTDDESESH